MDCLSSIFRSRSNYAIVPCGEDMELRIVRHAESTGNAAGRWQGRDDTQLTGTGREQASKLGKSFKAEGYQPSHIYASPLSRTFDTARIASSHIGLEESIVKWDDLMETDVGIFSGLNWEDIETRYPEIAVDFAETRNMDIVEGAETLAERNSRARRVVDRIIADHDNDHQVLVVSHGGFMQFIFAELVGSNRLWGLSVRNTGVFDFSVDVEKWHLGDHALGNVNVSRINRFNDVRHLEGS